jgi:pyruvate carboxylase
VGPDFDSLLAKVIVHGSTFEEATQRAKRALRELRVGGEVKTNLGLLAGVVEHRAWSEGTIDTMWLERNVEEVVRLGTESLNSRKTLGVGKRSYGTTGSGSLSVPSSAKNVLLQSGSLFHLTLSAAGALGPTADSTKHTVTISSIAHNSFPDRLSGTLQTTLTPSPFNFDLTQSSSAAIYSASFELADPNNTAHVGSPLTGMIVELHPALLADDPDGSHVVKKGDTLAVLSVMKMETTVAAPRSGIIARRGKGVRVGIVIGEGVMIAVIGSVPLADSDSGPKSRL